MFSYGLFMVAIGINIAVGLLGYGLDWFLTTPRVAVQLCGPITELWARITGRRQQAVSFREAYGRSGSEDDIASGVGYDPPDGSRDLDLGFLVPLPSGFNPGEFRLEGSIIGNCFTPPLRGSQSCCGNFSIGVLKALTC